MAVFTRKNKLKVKKIPTMNLIINAHKPTGI